MMRKLWLLIPFVLMMAGCKNDASKRSDLIYRMPGNAAIIIKTKSVEGLKSVFKNNSLLDGLSEFGTIKNLEPKLHYLNHLKPSDPLLISFGKNDRDSLQIAVATRYHKDLFKLDSVPNRMVETYTHNNATISKTTLDHQTIYSVVKDSIFFASNDQHLTETAFDGDPATDEALVKVFQTAGTDKTATVVFNLKQNAMAPSWSFIPELNKAPLCSYLLLDADLSQDRLLFNGIAKATDSTKSLTNVFKHTIPQENQLPSICPPDADGFVSFTFNNYKTFSDNLRKFNKRDSTASNALFETASEVGVIYRGAEQAVMVRTLDARAMGDLLLTQNALETYRDVDIFPFDQPLLFSECFAPFITDADVSKYANMDDFFVFSKSDALLKDIISSYQNTAALSEAPAFQHAMEQMSDESSLLVFMDPERLNAVIDTNFDAQKTLDLKAFRATAIQFIQDIDFAHVNAVIQKHKGKVVANSVSEDINVTLDNDLLTDPQFVNNHTNNQMDLVVQDIKNNLYLISNDGKVLWKKQLDGRVLGKIAQIDRFKNGRLQLAFATQNKVYVMDRNGKDVSPFPLKFNNNITQPLSVFDYDGKRDYRLMVTQGASVSMYDGQGNIVKGFTYKKAQNTINSQPKHFRINTKDYLVFVQGNELEILDRTGKTRIDVKNNIPFSGNELFVYNNKFTATTQTGDLIQIDTNGHLTSLNLNLGEKHAMTATSKTLVTLSDNILTIKTHRVEMDFGVYTPPKIFYLNDKIYVSVTDLQTKKVYLFDSLGKEISNFPVYGNSSIELNNIDNGKGLEFVTKGNSNSVLIYHMN